MSFTPDNITIFKSLFQGRQDVFATHWEKDGKSGYMPAYKVDWTDYREHIAKGGTFKDYPKKQYQLFTYAVILRHFHGSETV